MPYDNMDNAAAAWQWMLERQFPQSSQYEYASGIVPTTDGAFDYSEPRTSRRASEFRVPLPARMTALIHSHATQGAGGGDEQLSRSDISMAKLLKIPSYISTPKGALRRFDPATGKTEDVLAELPIDEIRKLYVRALTK